MPPAVTPPLACRPRYVSHGTGPAPEPMDGYRLTPLAGAAG
jgi:hypothetical protein